MGAERAGAAGGAGTDGIAGLMMEAAGLDGGPGLKFGTEEVCAGIGVGFCSDIVFPGVLRTEMGAAGAGEAVYPRIMFL